MFLIRLLVIALSFLLAVAPLSAELTPENVRTMPAAEIEKLLPNEHPA